MEALFLYPKPKSFLLSKEKAQISEAISWRLNPEFPDQYYEMIVKAETTKVIYGKDAKSLAESTFHQLMRQKESINQAFHLKDWPDIQCRGFMLDVSRCRVPTRERLNGLVHLLWLFKYNELQLYCEHTFAYRNHRQVWENSSPLTADDIQWLDKLCRDKGIRLIPNQNCFGHMERWLKHKGYRELAECPEGYLHPIGGERKYGGTLVPSEKSADFADELLRELLPNFSTKEVNIGCDETWELGQGRSEKAVKKKGKRAVYLEHLERLVNRVEGLGYRPQVWADILLSEETTLPDSLMGRFTPMIWGYEADHPFASECARIAQYTNDFYVVPGTSCWNSFTCRWENAKANIKSACEQAVSFGAKGVLLTSWGDNGHHYPFAMMLPAIALAAVESWKGNSREEDCFQSLERLLGVKRDEIEGLRKLFQIDAGWGENPFNNSLSWLIVTKGQAGLPKQGQTKNTEWLYSMEETLESLKALKSEPWTQVSMSQWSFVNDLNLSIELLYYSARRGIEQNCEFPQKLRDQFKVNWHQQSRSGGFEESLKRL